MQKFVSETSELASSLFISNPKAKRNGFLYWGADGDEGTMDRNALFIHKIWKQSSWVCGFWNVFIEWLNSEQALSRAGMVKEQIECPGEEGGGAWEPWEGYIVYLLLKAMACLTSVLRSQWQVASQPNYNLWALSFFKSFNSLGDLYKVWNLYVLVRTNPNPPYVWMSLDKYFQHLIKLDLSFFKPTSIELGLN